MVCDQFAEEMNGVNYIMVGNPGTGKSTMLNGLTQKVLFQSGTNFGSGMTKTLQAETIGKNTFMDTPGLADIKMRKEAAAAITAALKKGGVFKIFFVLTLESGRVRPADRTTMELVLESAPISQYGVIINKLEEEEYRMLENNIDQARDLVLEGLMHGLPTKSIYWYLGKRKAELAGKKDQIFPLDPELMRFIDYTPAIQIRPEQVNGIKADQFEKLNEEMQQMIARMQEDKAVLMKMMDQDRAMFEQMVEEMRQRNKELEHKIANMPKGGGFWGIFGKILGAVVPIVGPVAMAFR
jgi:GTP-binding protein EngB required for normal cell division